MTRSVLQLRIERAFRLSAPRRDAAPSRLRLALVRMRPRRPQVVTRAVSTTIRPQIRLVLTPRYELAGRDYGPPLALPEVREAAAVRHEVERLVERIAMRTTRVEAPARPGRPATAARAERRAAPVAARSATFAGSTPEQMLLAATPAFPRLVPPRAPTSPVAPPEPPSQPARLLQPLGSSPSAPAARVEPPLDVAGIADRVLETLDRRLIAERERRGRI